MYRLPRGRYPVAGDDGRDVCLRRAHAVDGGSTRHRPARHLRLGDSGRAICHCCRAFCEPVAAAFSTRRHRNHHPGDRHFPDAGRHQLGRWRPADLDQDRRWRAGRVSQSRLWPITGARHCAVRAAGDPRPDQMGLRLRRQCRGAARHRGGRHPCRGPWRHAFREGRRGAMGRDRAAAAFRHAEISARPHRHHVHRDDRGDDRIRLVCSWRWAKSPARPSAATR